MRPVILGSIFMLLCSGCAWFSYELSPPVVGPLDVSTHHGETCGPIILGLGLGDLRVADAMREAGITQPTSISLVQRYVLVFGWNCLMVDGTGPGPVMPPPSTAPLFRRR